jgi:hypothetical protein
MSDEATRLAEARQARDELLEELRAAHESIGWLRAELKVLTRPASRLERALRWAASFLRRAPP